MRTSIKLSLFYLLILALGVALSSLIFMHAFRIEQRSSAFAQDTLPLLKEINQARTALVEHERGLYEYYATNDDVASEELIKTLELRIDAHFAFLLLQLGSQHLDPVLNSYHALKAQTHTFFATMLARPLDWDLARENLVVISASGRVIGPQLDSLVSLIQGRAENDSAETHERITTMKFAVFLYSLLITLIAAGVAYYVNLYVRESMERRRLAMFAERNPQPVISVDWEGNIRYQNPASEQLAVCASQRGLLPENLAQHISEARRRRESSVEWCYQVGDLWFSASLSLLYDLDMCHIHLKDITQQKHASDSLEHLAYFDELTSLGNRRRFRQQVTESIPLCRSQACLFLISLERLQPITNSSGYEIVDELMVASAQRIEYWISQQGTQQSHLARFDSYGFSVWLEMAEPEEVGVLARDLVSAFEQALYTEDGPFYLDVSLGVSCFPQDGSAYDDLLKNADAARARASASSASSAFCLFSQDMFLREQDWLAMEQALREAQQKGELALFYQPQVDMDTLDLLGFEALLRWRHDTRGMVSPAEFIPLAEQSGLILPIGEWVFKTACQQAKIWFDQGFEQLKIAVNISARQFQDHQFIDRIQSVLELTGVDPCMIELEITESVMLDNQAQAIDLLKQLKALGLGLAMDDFGTGYSSLSYLTQFPMDKLKIDRSFVTDVQDSEDKIAVVRTIIDLARHLGLRVIAEGVETDAERQLLLRYHCQEMQGFYFSPAVDAEQAGSFLHDTGQQSQRFP